MPGDRAGTPGGRASSLTGRRIAVTRAAEQAGGLLALLEERGAEALACPTIAIEPPDSYEPLDDAVRSLERYDWAAFTSANGVTAFADRLAALGRTAPQMLRIAAVGQATARVLTERVRSPDFVSQTPLAEALATELEDVGGRRVLWVRGNLAGAPFAQRLRARGATVDEVVAYRTVGGEGVRELARLLRAGGVDAILFMSGSGVRYLLDALQGSGSTEERGGGSLLGGPRRPAVVCIGPQTARAARDAGIDVDAVADERTDAGIVEAVERWFAAGATKGRRADADLERR